MSRSVRSNNFHATIARAPATQKFKRHAPSNCYRNSAHSYFAFHPTLATLRRPNVTFIPTEEFAMQSSARTEFVELNEGREHEENFDFLCTSGRRYCRGNARCSR